jgi:collagenase-like PrtC family protease
MTRRGVMGHSYSVSARFKKPERSILHFLEKRFSLELSEIDSVFGFAEYTSLYGGRIFSDRQLSGPDIEDLNTLGIGFRIPLTNHFITAQEYDKEKWFLEKYYNPLNSIIAVNDTLARWIRRDFPDYKIEASVIKSLNTPEKIDLALDLYDSVVPPMDLNDDLEFLEALPKDKIRLFANSFCAVNCPAKICYRSVSEINKGKDTPFLCSQQTKPWKFDGKETKWDIEKFKAMGFTKFKILDNKEAQKPALLPGNVKITAII